MTVTDLYNELHHWLWLFQNAPFPKMDDPILSQFNDQVHRHWLHDMLVDVSHLEIPYELRYSLIENDLKEVIELAKTGDITHAPKVSRLLLKVIHHLMIHYNFKTILSPN